MLPFIVFVPTIVNDGFYIFDTSQVQEFAILILGSIGFIIFLVQEKRLKKNIAEKTDIQRKISRMTKDLTHSYSYIGEINRKLDIFEQVTLSYPESPNLTAKKQKALYNAIIEAVKLFGKSDEFMLRFVRMPNNDVLKEIKSSSNLSFNCPLKNCNPSTQFLESDEFITISSPKAIDNIFSCIIIRKKSPNQKLDDWEMLKALAAQALFLFMFVNNRKQKG
jgi:hypothetical protein